MCCTKGSRTTSRKLLPVLRGRDVNVGRLSGATEIPLLAGAGSAITRLCHPSTVRINLDGRKCPRLDRAKGVVRHWSRGDCTMALMTYAQLVGQRGERERGSSRERGREGSIGVIAISHAIVSPRDPASG